MIRTVAILAILGLILSTAAAQTTRVVPSAAYPTIQSAIDASSWGDTVQILPGSYFESLVINGKSITLSGAGAGLSMVDGLGGQRCLEIKGNPLLTVIQTVTIRDLGFSFGHAPTNATSTAPTGGGGILVRQGVHQVDLVDCVIDHCEAPWGGGILAEAGVRLALDGCHLHDCGWPANAALPAVSPRGGAIWCSTWLRATTCRFEDNALPVPTPTALGSSGGAIYMEAQANSALELVDCDFARNRADGDAVLAANGLDSASISRCRFIDNRSVLTAALRLSVGQWARLSFCLFTGNDASGLAKVLELNGNQVTVDRCSFVNNGPANTGSRPILLRAAAASGTVNPPPSLAFNEGIVTGNGDDRLRFECLNAVTAVVDHAILGATPEVLSAITLAPIPPSLLRYYLSPDAGLVDEAAGDCHLRPGALATDSGRNGAILAAPFLGLDLDGNPALVGSHFDLGCYELQNRDPGPAWAGSVPDGAGGTVDTLTFDGDAGGLLRRQIKALATPITLAMAPAPGDAISHFVIFGYLGLPRVSDAIPVPFAQGVVIFAPQPLVPFSPAHITLADATGAFPAIIWAPPAPWSITGLTSPVPARLTLQAFQTVGATEVRLSNAIVLDVQ